MGQALSIFVGADQVPDPGLEVEFQWQRVGNYNFTREKLEELNRQAVVVEEAEVSRIQDLVVSWLARPMTVTAVVKALRESFPWMSPAYLYAWRVKYPEFADAWDQAYAAGTDELEDVGISVAKDGNSSMLQFLMKQRNVERYGITRIEATGKNGTDLIPRMIQIEVLEPGQQAPVPGLPAPAQGGPDDGQ